MLDVEARQHIAPILVVRVGVAPQKRLNGELQTRAELAPLDFVAAEIIINRLNRDVVETKIRPIEPGAERKITVADEFDKFILALGVINALARQPKTRARLFPFFRKKFLIKRVEPLAFEFRGRYTRLRLKSCCSPLSSVNKRQSCRVVRESLRLFLRL